MIARITKAYVRHYSDNGQTTAYVEWIDHKGEKGRTEGPVSCAFKDIAKGKLADVYGLHIGTLMARAICSGLDIEREMW